MSSNISIVIPTRDRLKDLAELLDTLLHQTLMPLEVIVVDDSPRFTAKEFVGTYADRFKSIGCELKYFFGNAAGLTAARNEGIARFKGDFIFFLDDDTLLEPNVIENIYSFFRENSEALGAQPLILPSKKKSIIFQQATLQNALNKALFLNYTKDDEFSVRRSGASIFPKSLTKTIAVKRTSGCCCYKRQVFFSRKFDLKLKRWGFMEDLDFSYRINKKYPNSLFILPNAKILHKTSTNARLPNRVSICMVTIYWSYVFFKDVFDGSFRNLFAFMWGLAGQLFLSIIFLIAKRKSKLDWWSLIYLAQSYILALKNFRKILNQKLDFFNSKL